MKRDFKQTVTELTDNLISHIEDCIDTGKAPIWKKGWSAFMQQNPVTGTIYSGSNALNLMIEAENKGYNMPYWLTWNNIQQVGGRVKKGEKASVVFYWQIVNKIITDDNGNNKKNSFPLFRYFNVWNSDQIELPEEYRAELGEKKGELNTEIKTAEDVLKLYVNMPEIKRGEPSYVKSTDTIYVPDLKDFDDSENYYASLFHEVIHSTGHEKRLNRKSLVESDGFGNSVYSQEELVAEFGASILMAYAGIESPAMTENNIAYLRGWLKPLKDDIKFAYNAMRDAHKATSYIIEAKKKKKEAEAA